MRKFKASLVALMMVTVLVFIPESETVYPGCAVPVTLATTRK